MRTVIDVAGSATGGSARWRQEAKRWLATSGCQDVSLIGEGQRVEFRWLAHRELVPAFRRIATNNVAFVRGKGTKVVLLRNALHFLTPRERRTLPDFDNQILRQARVVALLAHRADVIVVPSTAMKHRVASAQPSLEARTVVRHHPVTVPPSSAGRPEPYVLFPSLPARHKDLDGHLALLIAGLEEAASSLSVKVTTQPNLLGSIARCSRVCAIGPQDLLQMDALRGAATAVYAPYEIESFGYPVAEGRAAGVPVLAPGTEHNREIGGKALVGYVPGDVASIARASDLARQARPAPDPLPFDAHSYFSWLVSL